MLTCREVTALASQHLDGELPLGTRMGLRLHLMMCKHCRRYIRQLRATVVLLAALRAAPSGPPPDATAVEQLAATLAALPPDGDDTG